MNIESIRKLLFLFILLGKTSFAITRTIVEEVFEVDGEECVDSQTNFDAGGGRFGCPVIGDNIQYCNNDRVSSHCPLTCDACDLYACEDSTFQFTFAGRSLLCITIESLSEELLETACAFDAISTTCRASCGHCGIDTPQPTPSPTPEVTPQPVDPSTFCENLNICNLDGPGNCQISSSGPGVSSCPAGVPLGYYPDLSRCDAYCFCSGSEVPSTYSIVASGLLWDTHAQGALNSYLDGVWGENGAWGTNGGGAVFPLRLSAEGQQRPPQC